MRAVCCFGVTTLLWLSSLAVVGEIGDPSQRDVAGVAAMNSIKQHIECGFSCKHNFLFFLLILSTSHVSPLHLLGAVLWFNFDC